MSVAVMLMISGAAAADSVAEFYKGKTVSLVVSTPPGGGYDLHARPVGNHIGRHIPGNPNVVVQNMPGAGGLRALNHLYNAAAQDGTVFGIVHSTAPYAGLLGTGTTKFDPTKISWVGSMNRQGSFCVAWHEAPLKTFEDAYKIESLVGATGWGSSMALYPHVMNRLLGTKFKIIAGYDGGNSVYLALERGEAHVRCGVTITPLRSIHPKWITDRKVRFLVQTALTPNPAPELKGVPLVIDSAKTKEDRMIFEILFANHEMDTPFLAPPNVPADRLAALRAAFKATMADPKFIADTKKAGLLIDYVPGEAIEKLMKQTFSIPPELANRVKEILAAKK
jgi:tripartite-type tricarboxylate transporter receptor subunit TctC